MKTLSLTPWSNLYLGESKYNIEIIASRLCVLFYGWSFIGVTFLFGMILSPLKYYGFIVLAALCLSLLFYQWAMSKTLFFFNVFTTNLSQVCSLALSVKLNTDTASSTGNQQREEFISQALNFDVCHVSVLFKNNVPEPIVKSAPPPYLPNINTPSSQVLDLTSEKNIKQEKKLRLDGVISARSRVCSVGVWLVIDVKDNTYKKNKRSNWLQKVKGESGRQTFFLFKDNMSMIDFKRVCRMIHFAKYSANSGSN